MSDFSTGLVPGGPGGGGANGKSAYELAVAAGFQGTVVEWLASLHGPAGASAYQVAVANGFTGTISEWLASLVGPPGGGGGGVAVDRGLWAVGTAYSAGDIVTKNGRRWQAKANVPSTMRFLRTAEWTSITPQRPAPRGNVLDCDQGHLGYSSAMSDGVATGQNTYDPHIVRSALGACIVRFPAFQYKVTNDDINSPDPWLLSASAAVGTTAALAAAATPIPLTFNGGQRTVTITPGMSYVDTDPVHLPVGAGEYVGFRSYQRVATQGQKWIAYQALNNSQKGYGNRIARAGTSETDLTLTTSLAGYANNGTANVGYGPILAFPINPTAQAVPGWVQFTDSISQGNVYPSKVGANLAVPRLDFGKIGATGGGLDYDARFRFPAQAGISRLGYALYGRNDGSGLNVDQMWDKQARVWAAMRSAGVEVIAVGTYPPCTSSTDNWATPGGQTPQVAGDVMRLAYNDRLRNNYGGLIDICVDVAAVCQDPNDPKIWVTSNNIPFYATNGGVHASGVGPGNGLDFQDIIVAAVQASFVEALKL